MKREQRREAKENIKELLERDFKCVLVVTNAGMVFNGGGQDFLATLSMVINKAITDVGIPRELVERAIELGLETAEDEEDDDENAQEEKDNVNEKMLEILELMKKKLEK